MPAAVVPSPQNHTKIKPPQVFIDNAQKWENANAKDAYAKRISADEDKLRNICSKELTQSGVQAITKFAKDYDLSYASFLLSITNKYLVPALKFWTKPSQQVKKSIHELMATLNSRLHALPLPFMLNQFQQLKKKYQNVSKRKLEVATKPQVSKYETEQKARQFLDEQKDRYENKPILQVHVMKQEQKKPETELCIIQTNKDFGSNWKQSKIQSWREIYFKIELQFEHKRKLVETQEGRAFLQTMLTDRQQLQLKTKDTSTAAEKKTAGHSAGSSTMQSETKQLNRERQERIISQYALLKQIQKRSSADRDCLGCTKFFYESDDLAFPVPKQAVTYVHSRRNMDNIWRQIVGYLNNKGGIILVGCRKDNEKILPDVQDIAEHEKESLENKMHSLRTSIFPNISIDKHLIIQFVPVAHDPRKFASLTQPQYIKGAYILRLTVVPLQPEQVYSYNYKTVQGKIVVYFYRQIQGQCCKIQGPSIYDFMKKRYRTFGDSPKEPAKEAKDQIKQEYKDQLKDQFLRNKDPQLPALFYHNYTCRMPEKGDQYFGQKDCHIVRERPDMKEQNPMQANRKNFNSVSLIVMDKSALEEARHLFKNIGKHDIEIDVAFPEQQFILSNTTFLIWHNCKFEKLMQTLKSSDGQALKSRNRKITLLINTVRSILLDKELTKQHRANIVGEARRAAREEVELIQKEVVDGQRQYLKHYIKCQTVITAVYMYFYINSNFKEKDKCRYKVKFDKVSATPVNESNKANNKNGEIKYEGKPKREEYKYQDKVAYQSSKKYKQAPRHQVRQNEYPAYDYTKDEYQGQEDYSQQPATEQDSKMNMSSSEKSQYLEEIVEQSMQNSYNTNSYDTGYVPPNAYQYPVQISQIIQGNPQQAYYRIENGYFCYYYSNGIVDYYLPNSTYYGSSYYQPNG